MRRNTRHPMSREEVCSLILAYRDLVRQAGKLGRAGSTATAAEMLTVAKFGTTRLLNTNRATTNHQMMREYLGLDERDFVSVAEDVSESIRRALLQLTPESSYDIETRATVRRMHPHAKEHTFVRSASELDAALFVASDSLNTLVHMARCK